MSGPRSPAPAGGGSNRSPIRTILEFTDIEDNDAREGHVDLSIYEVDPNNTPAAAAPVALKSHLSESTKDGNITAIGMITTNGIMMEYLIPAITTIRTGGSSPLDGKLIANIGDFDKIDGGFYLAEIKTDPHMKLVQNSVLCSAPDTIHAAAQAHTGPGRFLLGPYAPGDAGVTATHSRKFFEIPYFLISKCGKAAPGGHVTVLYFWITLYPLIVAKGPAMVAACKPLLDAFRLAATDAGTGGSIMDVAEKDLPTVIGPDDDLKKARVRLMRRILPFRRQGSQSQAGDASVANAMDNQTEVMREQFIFAKNQAAEAKQTKLRKAVGGEAQMTYLCTQVGARNFKELPELLRLLIEAGTDAQRDKLLNDAAKEMAKTLHIAVAPVYPPGFGTKVVTERWEMSADDEPETGSVFNLLLLAAPKDQAKEMVAEARAAAPERSATRVTKAERRLLDDAKLFLTTPRSAIVAFRHFYVLVHLLCVDTNTHPLTVWSKAYLQRLSLGGMEQIMLHPARAGDSEQHLQGVQFQIAVSSHLKSYATKNTALDNDLIFGDVDEMIHWEPVTRTMRVLKSDFGLTAVQNASRRLQGLAIDSDATTVTVATNRSRAGTSIARWGLPVGGDGGDDVSVLSQPPVAAPPPPAAPPAPWVQARSPRAAASAPGQATGSTAGSATGPAAPTNRPTIVRNHGFLRDLWVLRTGCDSALGAKGSDLIKAAEAGIICTPVPRSKASPLRNMCLNFHVRGTCTESCPYSYDHVTYTQEEYEAADGLVPWMDGGNFRPLTDAEYATLGLNPPRRNSGRRTRGGRGRNRGGRGGRSA